jgi:hypothetical protein
MFTPPPTKKARQPLMSGQRDVCARAGAAPTGAAATGGVPTPLREEPWPTRPQISVHCDSPSPSPGHDRGETPPVHRQAMTEAVSPRFLVLHRPAYGLGRAAWSPRPPDGSWRRRRHLLLGAPLFVPCPGTSGSAKSLSLMLTLTPCLLFCCVQFDPQS